MAEKKGGGQKMSGGRRPGSGQPKGHKQQSTLAKEEAERQKLQEIGLTAARVLLEYARLGMADIRDFYDPNGNLVPIQQWTPAMGAVVASMEVVIKNTAAGDGITDRVHKFKLWDKTRALESLAKHFGLLVERLEHSGGMTIRHEMPE